MNLDLCIHPSAPRQDEQENALVYRPPNTLAVLAFGQNQKDEHLKESSTNFLGAGQENFLKKTRGNKASDQSRDLNEIPCRVRLELVQG
jgi:hypothetical protein